MEAYPSYHDSCFTNERTLSEKVEQVRDELKRVVEHDSLESLELIDSIQRLGLCFHFKHEIEAILHRQYVANSTDCDDLYEASLRFRLLRLQGHPVLADEYFKKVLCDDGELRFKEELAGGTRGLMAMHEASHLNQGGEEILYEAAMFSSHHLNDKVKRCTDQEEVKMAKHCLLHPQHKSLAHFTAKSYLRLLHGEYPWENLLRDLAELEFVRSEVVHKHEILQVTGWWKRMWLGKELKSSRNQPMKWHMWSTAILRSADWSNRRILLTKPISLVYVVDDIFDLYGEIHDLSHFTQAVKRWDASATDQLPSYMKTCFNAIFDTTNEISSFVSQEYGWNPIHFLRKEWGSLMEAFLAEAKWFRSSDDESVTADEYLKNGVISSGVPMVLSHLFFLTGNPLTLQNQTLLNDPHGLTHSVAKLLRLLDDLGSAQDERQEGYDGSYVECCIREGRVDSMEGAREHVMGMVWETWENINKHGLSSTNPFSACFRQACLNAARMVPTMYSYDTNHRLPLLNHYVKSMFRDATLAKSILG